MIGGPRMDSAQGASVAGRELARAGWSNTVAVRAAETVIDRADQVPEAPKAEVLQALGQEAHDDG